MQQATFIKPKTMSAQTLYHKLWHSHVVREEADGTALLGSGGPLRDALAAAGFVATPRGLRIRA